MRIDKTSDERTSKSITKKKVATSGRTARAAKSAGSFNEKLLETQTARIREELDLLLGQIDTQAKEIEKSLTFESLRVYTELIRKFLSVVVNDLYKVEQKHSVSPTGKKKTHILVKKVDDALDKMTKEFLEKQGNLIGFLARLDQIRGMLLDLYS